MLTTKTIKALKADAKPYRKFEGGPDKGFGIQVSKGAKTFFLQYRAPVTKKRRFINLGTYPGTTLAEARQRCREARALTEQGKDPQVERDLFRLAASRSIIFCAVSE